jgi:hypothetical protein
VEPNRDGRAKRVQQVRLQRRVQRIKRLVPARRAPDQLQRVRRHSDAERASAGWAVRNLWGHDTLRTSAPSEGWREVAAQLQSLRTSFATARRA